jgi:hypothetical protein
MRVVLTKNCHVRYNVSQTGDVIALAGAHELLAT